MFKVRSLPAIFSLSKFKFIISGGVNTTISYIIFVGLTLMEVHYIIASLSGYVLAMFCSFILNKRWAFQSKKKSSFTLFGKFILVNFTSLAASLFSLSFFVESLTLNLYFAQAICILITMLINYTGYKYIFTK